MRRYKSTKFYEWGDDIAYLAGLIASDGCMFNDYRHINLTSKDRELIDTTLAILGLNVKVSMKLSQYGSLGYNLTFSNVALYDFFFNAGIEPAKSKTISRVLVPDEFYSSFLRGYFDGDGSIYGFWDMRWKNSLMFYTEYASASDIFLLWLQEQNRRLAGTGNGRIKHSPKVRALSYAKADSRLLFKFMYGDGSGPRLTRKYEKFIDFLEMDPYANQVSASGGMAYTRV